MKPARPLGAIQRSPNLLVAAAVLFAAVLALRLLVTVPGWGITLLYDVPVALVAVAYGARAGLAAAAVGFALFVFGEQVAPIHVAGIAVQPNAAGYVSRAVVFVLLGGLLGLYSDRVRGSQARAQAGEARFRRLVEAAPDATVIVDEGGAVVYFNEQAQTLFGYAPEELVGLPVEKLIPDRFRRRHLAHRSRYADRPSTRPMGEDLELHAMHRDGHEIPVEISLAPLETEAGVLVSAAIRDISERRQAEARLRQAREELTQQNQELERSNAELARFAHIASHDLQEPLRVITGFVELLARRYEGRLDEDADTFIASTVAGVERMQDLIEALLWYSRVGNSVAAQEPVDIERLVQRIADRIKASSEAGKANVIANGLPKVEGDPVLLEQLFENLMTNALKFSDADQPRVEISADRKNGDWTFSVTDNGPGIEARHREQIFEMFKRLHGRSVAGTGVGLAICRRITELHGGRIWVESDPGAGSSFIFTIPSSHAMNAGNAA